jgi:hydroxymethylbilane synthase
MKMKKRWIIGTRGSKLALKQTEMVTASLEQHYPDHRFLVKTIKTTGDTIWDKPLHLIGGKGLFVKEIEEDLLRRGIDLAVHSMKDVPTELEPGLIIGAVMAREDPRDVLISRDSIRWSDLGPGTKIGTNSLRRKAQILFCNRDIEVVPLRGNVDTRIRKMHDLQLDAIILACAGVKRMGLQDRIGEILSLEAMVPSAGQGAIAIEIRDEAESSELVNAVNDRKSFDEVAIERTLQSAIGGSCQVPLGIHARIEGDSFDLHVVFGREDGTLLLKDTWRGSVEDTDKIIGEVLRKLKT